MCHRYCTTCTVIYIFALEITSNYIKRFLIYRAKHLYCINLHIFRASYVHTYSIYILLYIPKTFIWVIHEVNKLLTNLDFMLPKLQGCLHKWCSNVFNKNIVRTLSNIMLYISLHKIYRNTFDVVIIMVCYVWFNIYKYSHKCKTYMKCPIVTLAYNLWYYIGYLRLFACNSKCYFILCYLLLFTWDFHLRLKKIERIEEIEEFSY